MNRLKYTGIEPITRKEAEVAFAVGSATDICHALIRVVYHDPYWRWLQERCIQFSKHDDSEVAGSPKKCKRGKPCRDRGPHQSPIHHRPVLASAPGISCISDQPLHNGPF